MPASLLAYSAGFAAIMLVAHLVVRKFAPWADPLMLPLAALLNGLGVVMIYRLQESGRDGNPGNVISTLTRGAAVTQLVWTAVGVIAFVLVLVRDPVAAGAAALHLHPGRGRPDPAGHPGVAAGQLSSVQGAKVWIILGGFEIQPGEFAKLALAVFFAGYLVDKRDVLALAGRRVLGIDLPRARDLGPVLIAWGASLLILVFETDIGTVGPVLRPVRGDDLRRDPADVLAADRHPAVPGRRLGGQHAVRPRRRPVHGLAAPVHLGQRLLPGEQPALRELLPARAGPVRDGLRRHLRHRARPRPAVLDAAGAERLHHLGVRRGARPDRPDGACC